VPVVIEGVLPIVDIPFSFVADLVVMPFRTPAESDGEKKEFEAACRRVWPRPNAARPRSPGRRSRDCPRSPDQALELDSATLEVDLPSTLREVPQRP
jgi:hypothetical protein